VVLLKLSIPGRQRSTTSAATMAWVDPAATTPGVVLAQRVGSFSGIPTSAETSGVLMAAFADGGW